MISVEGLVVDSVWEAVRHIGNTMPGRPAATRDTETSISALSPQKIETPGASATLFALTIGINTYKYERRPELPNLVGCVADADAIVEYLTTKLHVPKDHIACLRDSHATRANIIQSLVDLSEDPRIEKKKGDAILIFYAGHGGTAIAPSGWPAKGSDVIEMILPHDFFPGTNDKPECQGLHDITLGALLSQLAQMKGNNITVILDSCHSGSGTRTAATEVSSTRAAFNVRGADLPPDYKILPAVDQELLRHLASSRKANALNTSTSDLYSHVLLAGTSARGVSLEDRILKRGVFTSAVLNLLERTSPDTISYKDVITRLPDLPDQFPQCEGYYQGRALFNGKAPMATRLLFRVIKQNGNFVLEAGEAQGLAAGAKFGLYKDKEISAAPYGYADIKGVPRASTSILTDPSFPDGTKPMRSEVPSTLWALQTYVGNNVSKISVALPPEEAFVPLIRRVVGSMDKQRPTKRNIELVDPNKPHELRLRARISGEVIFEINDPHVNALGVKSIVHSVPVSDDEQVFLILSRAADFYHHFRRSNKQGSIAQHVSLNAYSLSRQSQSVASEDVRVWLPADVDENLNVNGFMTVDVTAAETAYGFSVINNTDNDLYVWAFFFELADLSIQTIYQPNFAKSIDGQQTLTPDPSILPRGELTLGYGPGGAVPYRFNITDDDLDVEVTYMKVFITTRPVDLSYVAQKSPFLESRKGVKVEDPPKDIWDTLTMAIVARGGFD